MNYIQGQDRREYTMFPDCIDDYVGKDAPVRLMDKFVNVLDMGKLGFARSVPNSEGRPSYDPRDLLKVYIYGYFYGIRSSRQLERQCKVNIEMMWLICKLTPDFRTISDFRKDNKYAVAKVFKEFNRFCLSEKLFSKSYISIDGSKFKAVNAKDRNFTLNKLDDRIGRLDSHIAEYMNELDNEDTEESDRTLNREEIEHKLEVAKSRKARYENHRKNLEDSGESQMSLTDPDARLMKQNEGFGVCYNTQTAIDADSHLIAGYIVTNNPTDHGQITELASEVKEAYGTDMLEATADKGYEEPKDMADALENGIVPNVITREGGKTKDIEVMYHEAELTDEQRSSRKPEDIKACMESGVIPDMYRGILTDVEVIEKKTYDKSDGITPGEVLSMSFDEMKSKATEGYFIRDANRNFVVCPMGEILRQKSIKSNGNIRYCNKLACKRCKNKCTTAAFKEADFNKDTLVKKIGKKKGQRDDAPQNPKGGQRIMKTYKIVRFKLHLDQNQQDNRKCLSEHPFGTIKRALGQSYFLLKTKAKVNAEMALFCLSYNMRRAINMVGTQKLMAALG